MQLSLLDDPFALRPHDVRPQVHRFEGGRVTLLCPYGHLICSMAADDWAASGYAARLADPDYTVACANGAVPVEMWWRSQCS